MSYDLFLFSERSPLTEQQFASYFGDREHYTLENNQAFYENPDTGVYFCLDFPTGDSPAVAFNLNYFRPHFFGLEAAPELAAFVKEFGLSIHDPQDDGMGDGPFSVDGFLRGWNAGNRFGYQAFLADENPPDFYVYPTQGLQRVWQWNYRRRAVQEQVGESLFVPIFMFMRRDGDNQARTCVVWPDACPIYLPQADLVYVIRNELASKPVTEDSPEVAVVEWSAIEPAIAHFPRDDKARFFRLDYESAPSELVEFIRSLPLISDDREMGVPYDNVLNAELVDEFAKTG